MLTAEFFTDLHRVLQPDLVPAALGQDAAALGSYLQGHATRGGCEVVDVDNNCEHDEMTMLLFNAIERNHHGVVAAVLSDERFRQAIRYE